MSEVVYEPVAGTRVERAVAGKYLVFYALAVTLILVGSLKFFAYEAMAIEPLVTNSPLISWVYNIWDVQTFAVILGSAEIVAGLFIALRPVAPRLSVIGGIFAAVLFFVTGDVPVRYPRVFTNQKNSRFSRRMRGQFLAKDLLLLAASIWVIQDSLAASRSGMTRVETRTMP